MPNQGMSKRQMLREKRAREQQRGRLMTIGGIVLVAVAVVALVVIPMLKPVELVEITPQEFPLADMNTMGDPNAPVKVEVWEDFQCPACKNFTEDTEPLIIENYVKTGKVLYIFHHFPFLDDFVGGKESDQAASASMCAAEQEQFWNYKTMLFTNWNGENQGAFADRKLVAYAEFLGLDMNQFNQCFDANKYKAEIDESYNAGVDKGVQSTPSTFVNGVFVTNPNGANLVPSYQDIANMIEAALAETQ